MNLELFLVFAMQRSGQHGIINWIGQQHGDVIHFNNPRLNQAGTAYIPHRPEIGTTVYGRGMHSIVNLEGLPTAEYGFQLGIQAVSRFDVVHPILILRRYKNWLASTVMHEGNKGIRNRKLEKHEQLKWEKMHRNYSDHPSRAQDPGEFTVILYDKWFSDPEYRESICEQLKIPFTDAGLNTVPRFASGSTFDKRKFDGSAQQMKVLERWKDAKGKLYTDSMRHYSKLDRLSEELFNMGD